MKAPNKLYIHRTLHLGLLAASETNITGEDIEYIRPDAFIEKACEWLEPVFKELAGYYSGAELLDDFKNYLKGK